MAYEKVAVTGGSGLLGSHVIDNLSDSAFITSIDLKGPQSQNTKTNKFINASITDFNQMKQALRGHDAVIHLAAIPNPREATLDATFNNNVQGTWTVLQAAEEVGVRRVVVASSDSVFGLSYNPPDWSPQFLPVDETHPTRPIEVYSLSKKVTETIAESFAERRTMEVIAIRPCHIIFPRGYPEIKLRGQDIENYHFWAWVDPKDVAQAFKLATHTPDYTGYDVYTVAAEMGLNEVPTLDLVRQRWAEVPKLVKPSLYEKNPFASILDTTKIQERLGFRASVNLEKLKSKAKQAKI